MMGPLGGAAVGWGLGRSRRRATPWWYVAGQTCVAAYQPIGAASLAASYVNLAQPGTYDAAPGVAPTFDSATGWTFDRATDKNWLETGILVDTALYSAFVRFWSVNVNAAIPLGAITGTSSFFIDPAYNAGTSRRYSYGKGIILDGMLSGENIMGIAGTQGYLNGVADGDSLMPAPILDYTLNIGRRNGISPGWEFSGRIQALAIYSTTLSASDVAALTARMQAL
jgi:hypothetical protein